MVLDINLFRAEKGGTPDLIRASEKKRGNDGSNVDKVIELDEVWRKCKPNPRNILLSPKRPV
jgi:seryl-tRNA synthetase